MERYALIVAGGKGVRMGGTTPKQFLLLDNRPVIVHTLEKFLSFDPDIHLIVVIPADQEEEWSRLQATYFPETKIRVVHGGAERFHSVKAGLDTLGYRGLVAIHDAVRPFVGLQTIADSFLAAEEFGSGVAAVPLKDSIRELTEHGSTTRDRNHYRLVQTPQTFQLEKIKNAYDRAVRADFTDDAAVYEAAGYAVHLVEGSYSNIKITTPEDLKQKPV